MPNSHNRPLRFTRKDTAGELSPSAPSPLRGESWGKKAPGELYKGRRPLDTAGELSPSAPSPLRGESWGKKAPGELYKGRRPLDSPTVSGRMETPRSPAVPHHRAPLNRLSEEQPLISLPGGVGFGSRQLELRDTGTPVDNGHPAESEGD